MTHHGRTIAALVTLGLTGVGLAGPANAAPTGDSSTPQLKPIKIGAAAGPRQIDKPGTGKDIVRITNIPGVRWAVAGAVEDRYNTPFATSEKTVDVPVKAGGTSVTVTASVSEPTTTKLVSDVKSWSIPFTTTATPVVDVKDPVPLDYPGITKDAVQLTGVEGVTWKVGGMEVPAFTGTKTFVLAKLKVTVPAGDTASVAVAGTVNTAAGYAGTDLATSLDFTSTALVPLSQDAVKAAVSDTLNLPGRTRDTMTFSPITGVKFSVCGGKPFAATKTVVKSASCKSNPVPVRAVADKGYKILGGADNETTLTWTQAFEDTGNRKSVTIPADAAVVVDRAGTVNDVLSLATLKNVTWQYAFPTKDKAGNVTWKWTNAPKAKAGAKAVIVKMKAAKAPETTSTVFVRPVVDTDDFLISGGWTPVGDAQAEDGQTLTATTSLGTATIDTSVAPLGSLAEGIELFKVPGVTAWTVERTGNGATVKTTKSIVRVDPYTSVVVPTDDTTKVVVTPQLDKSYQLATDATKSWTFAQAPTAPTPPVVPAD